MGGREYQVFPLSAYKCQSGKIDCRGNHRTGLFMGVCRNSNCLAREEPVCQMPAQQETFSRGNGPVVEYL